MSGGEDGLEVCWFARVGFDAVWCVGLPDESSAPEGSWFLGCIYCAVGVIRCPGEPHLFASKARAEWG